MTEKSSTQLAMRICRVSTQLHPHCCVGHCHFLDMNHSASILEIRARSRHISSVLPVTRIVIYNQFFSWFNRLHGSVQKVQPVLSLLLTDMSQNCWVQKVTFVSLITAGKKVESKTSMALCVNIRQREAPLRC